MISLLKYFTTFMDLKRKCNKSYKGKYLIIKKEISDHLLCRNFFIKYKQKHELNLNTL
jgi:hypothetical protein